MEALFEAKAPHRRKTLDEHKKVFFLWLLFLLLILNSIPLAALENNILAPPDTTSPRNTMKYFIEQMKRSHQINLESGYNNKLGKNEILKASRCFDMSKIAPKFIEDEGIETALLLNEILDRIDIPPMKAIPGIDFVATNKTDSWIIPDTEIKINKIVKGERKDEFLFSTDTVGRIRQFYASVRHLPYKPGSTEDAYENYIYSPGPMIPLRLIQRLPDWTKIGFFEQMVWQWVALLMIMMVGTMMVIIVFQRTRPRLNEEKEPEARETKSWKTVLRPLTFMIVALLIEHVADKQINITGFFLELMKKGLRFSFFLATAWFIIIVSNALTEAIIASSRIKPKSIDENVTRLIFRCITLIFMVLLLWNTAGYLGLSLTAVFASAGLVGAAIALASKETFANFFGGVSILLDRPFRAGDFIILESGERGEVLMVGMRSTQILTRDDVQISIPNSVITNSKIVNESAPESRFRVRIPVSVAFGTDIDKVEKILLKLARTHHLVLASPEPKTRFRKFGDWSLDFELLCWTSRPLYKGRLIHAMNHSIYKSFKSADITIPFPMQDIRLFSENMEGHLSK